MFLSGPEDKNGKNVYWSLQPNEKMFKKRYKNLPLFTPWFVGKTNWEKMDMEKTNLEETNLEEANLEKTNVEKMALENTSKTHRERTITHKRKEKTDMLQGFSNAADLCRKNSLPTLNFCPRANAALFENEAERKKMQNRRGFL